MSHHPSIMAFPGGKHWEPALYRLHSWLPQMSSLSQLTLALTFPSQWELLLPNSLRELELSNIMNEDRTCPARVLLDLTNITCLNMNCVRGIDDVYFRRLKLLSSLQKCSLLVTDVTGSAFKHIHWRYLTFLSVGSSFDGCHFPLIGTAFPNLMDLRLAHCHNVRIVFSMQIILAV